MIATIYSLIKEKYDQFSEPLHLSPKQKKFHEQVTSFACEALRVYHGLKEFSNLYKSATLPSEFINNLHERTLCFAKMQEGFNSLQDKALSLGKFDPRIMELFNHIILYSYSCSFSQVFFDVIEKMAEELIDEARLIKNHPFKKYGLICIKDKFAPELKPQNLITESKLNKMIALQKSIFDKKDGIFMIEGNSLFVKKVQRDFEKLLTCKEGIKLAKNLIKCKKSLLISEGKNDLFYFAVNKIELTMEPLLKFGVFQNNLTRVIHPSWFTFGHELVHFIHAVVQKDLDFKLPCKKAANNLTWTTKEEKETIGDPYMPEDLTENGFIRNTFHLQRKYHQGPRALHFDKYTSGQKKWELERFERYYNEMVYNFKLDLNLADEILNSPMIKESFETKKICFFNFMGAAVEANEINLLKRIVLEHPEMCKKLPINYKRSLIVNALIKNLELAKLYIGVEFHLGLAEEISTIFKKETISPLDQKTIKAIVKNREMLGLTEQDLEPYNLNILILFAEDYFKNF